MSDEPFYATTDKLDAVIDKFLVRLSHAAVNDSFDQQIAALCDTVNEMEGGGEESITTLLMGCAERLAVHEGYLAGKSDD